MPNSQNTVEILTKPCDCLVFKCLLFLFLHQNKYTTPLPKLLRVYVNVSSYSRQALDCCSDTDKVEARDALWQEVIHHFKYFTP